MNFKGKKAIVTGGARGIGKSIAEALNKLGCYTIVTGTKPEKQRNFVNRNLHYMQLDFLDDKSIGAFLKKINKFKNIDILINNAGINIIEPIYDLKIENWEKILRVNLTGPMIMIKHVSRIMKRNKYGRILNVSSIFGLISREKRASYSASKSGLIGLTRATALDLAKYNVLVNALCPGFTRTELTFSILSRKDRQKLSKDIPLGRFAGVDEIAGAAVFLCSEANSYITGQIMVVDGGYIAK